jgi:methylated-DNA-[protein]-cysteine S-methyltransferase
MAINQEKLYELLAKIPCGRVTTYKELADKLKTKGYRAVGQIVGANPNAPKVPCHRVVKTDGGLGGYAFGLKKKIEILASEGVKISDGKVVDFEKKLFKF